MPRGNNIAAKFIGGLVFLAIFLVILFAIPIIIAWLIVQIWPSYGDVYWYLVALVFFLMLIFGGGGMSFRAHYRSGRSR